MFCSFTSYFPEAPILLEAPRESCLDFTIANKDVVHAGAFLIISLVSQLVLTILSK